MKNDIPFSWHISIGTKNSRYSAEAKRAIFLCVPIDISSFFIQKLPSHRKKGAIKRIPSHTTSVPKCILFSTQWLINSVPEAFSKIEAPRGFYWGGLHLFNFIQGQVELKLPESWPKCLAIQYSANLYSQTSD